MFRYFSYAQPFIPSHRITPPPPLTVESLSIATPAEYPLLLQVRMMEKLYACKIPFFAGITMEKLLSLSAHCDIVEAEPGKVIIEQASAPLSS